MVIALFEISDDRPLILNSQDKIQRSSSHLAMSTRTSLRTGLHSRPESIFSVSFFTAWRAKRVVKERPVRRLRLYLIEMLRLSLQTVDCATKAYSLGLVEFALYASKD